MFQVQNFQAPSLQAADNVKVAIISTLPPLNTSLSEYGKFLVDGLLGVTENIDLHIFADRPETEMDFDEMQHERLQVQRCWDFNAYQTPVKLAKAVKKLNPDVVIFNLQFASFGNQKVPAMLGLMTPMLLKKMGFPVMTILHNLPEAMDLDSPHFSRNKVDKWLLEAGTTAATQMLLQSDRLIVTLDKYKNILESKYKAHNVEVIGLGSYIEPAQDVKMTHENRFLTFGKFGTYKRLEFLLDSFVQLSASHPDAELVIGGTDHPNTPGYMESIEKQYGHLENVKFIGWIPDEELAERIQNCKALILSYESTAGSSGPLHLALSQGKPVVAPDFGDFQLVAETEDVRVQFYQHQSQESLLARLQEIASDSIDLYQICRHNLEVAQLNSWRKTARKYANLVYQCLPQAEATEKLRVLEPALVLQKS